MRVTTLIRCIVVTLGLALAPLAMAQSKCQSPFNPLKGTGSGGCPPGVPGHAQFGLFFHQGRDFLRSDYPVIHRFANAAVDFSNPTFVGDVNYLAGMLGKRLKNFELFQCRCASSLTSEAATLQTAFRNTMVAQMKAFVANRRDPTVVAALQASYVAVLPSMRALRCQATSKRTPYTPVAGQCTKTESATGTGDKRTTKITVVCGKGMCPRDSEIY